MLFVHAIVVSPPWLYFERVDEAGCLVLNSEDDHAALFTTWQEARRVQLWLQAQLPDKSTTLVPFLLTIRERGAPCRNS